MHTNTRNRLVLTALFLIAGALLTAGLSFGQAFAATLPASTCTVTGSNAVTCDLWAKSGVITLTGGSSVTVWGYADSAAGAVSLPGPALIVNQGTTVTINLTNNLGEATALLVPGQAMIPDMTGVAPGATKSYTFVASNPGTYLYEAGLLSNAQHQVAMGMYGALIVRPAAAGQAYASASTAFDDEALVVLSEIDPVLNNSANPAAFDMRAYHPTFALINGQAYSNTTAIDSLAGHRVLLRYVNAGLQAHSMTALGLRQTVIAIDGSPYQFAYSMVAETIAPGQTADAITTIPATAAAGSKFALYDGTFAMHNGGASGFGGMLTFITVGMAASGGDTTGPATSNMTLSPNPTNGSVNVALAASVSDAATGGSNVVAAEYFVDALGANGAGAAMSGAFGAPTVNVNATLNTALLAALSSGNHTVYVHGQDAAGNWGAFNHVTLNLDKVGPATMGLTLSPNPSNGAANVALHATGDDSASGGSTIAAAEYAIDGGAPSAMTVNGASPIASLDATISATTVNALSEGTHAVSVRSQDALGNWGAPSTTTLTLDKTGPTTPFVVVAPAATNGAQGVNSSTPAVRVTARFSDTLSKIAAGEGFVDAVGANGTGFIFIASDGVFNSSVETGTVDIPLTTINQLSAGNHTIYARGKDSSGNWGGTSTVILLIDKTAPTFTGISLAPNPTNGVSTVTMTVSGATDPLVSGLASGVLGGEYWLCPTTCANPAPGGGTPFTGLMPSIPVGSLATGTYTVSARIRDAAGNWSAGINSAALTVWANAIFSDGFESGALPGNWSSRSTNNANRLNVTTGAALVGTYGLQAQGNNTNYVQYNFGTTAVPAAPTYDARFYFRPNGNSSTGMDILSAGTSNFGATLFRVRYRLSGGTPQVQIQVGTSNTNAAWTSINGGTANNTIEVVWQSGGTLQLYVNGVLSQTLSATSGSVAAVRLGAVTGTGANTLMYFDAFASKRQVSPLIGQ